MSTEHTPSAAIDKMRCAMGPNRYKQVELHLILLRYISVTFRRMRDKREVEEFPRPDSYGEFFAENVFGVAQFGALPHSLAKLRSACLLTANSR
jgi:hypothetical protein